jgi:hypothetical protein
LQLYLLTFLTFVIVDLKIYNEGIKYETAKDFLGAYEINFDDAKTDWQTYEQVLRVDPIVTGSLRRLDLLGPTGLAFLRP